MADFFHTLLSTSIHGSIVILAVLLARLVLKKAPKKYICLMWMLAGIRLLLPIPIESRFSLQPPAIQIPMSVSLSAILPMVWVFMAAVIGLYSLGSYLHLRHQVLDAVKIPGGWESDRIETAFVLGFIKPKIYIPTGMSQQTRKQILAHERTHLDKGDHWIKMIGFLALTLHWFNPLVWLSYILLCKDIEMACDERVVQFMELDERKAYSSALLRCSTTKAHYAACPVAFGEISVKYRIKSILNYRKPSFWLSLLAILAFLFMGVCLMTSPRTVVEVPVDADKPLRDSSAQDPAAFTPAVAPEMEENPDWGIEVFMDCTSPTGGNLVYRFENRFIEASPSIVMRDAALEQWNGSAWEPVVGNAQNVVLFDKRGIGFAISRDRAVEYWSEELDWTLTCGALPAGDYRILQTIESTTDSATFCTPFHIYREKLPTEQEAALERCETALADLMVSDAYSVLLSASAPDGNVYPVTRYTHSSDTRIDHYVGDALVSSAVLAGMEGAQQVLGWDEGFHVNQNRKFLFPEGKSSISENEITFRSVWADYRGVSYQGMDTFRFLEDGRLRSAERLIQTMDETGVVVEEQIHRLEMALPEEIHPESTDWGGYARYVNSVGDYTVQDSFDSQQESPWNIFFRVDDDLLTSTGGEVWLSVDAVGVSNYTTDDAYWLEKKVGSLWQRLGEGNTTASWGSGDLKLKSRNQVVNVDWSDVYGQLEAGVYRMGKTFYHVGESIIQYAEFAIYQTGGVYGPGGEEALARVDAAIEKLHNSNYRVEEYNRGYTYDDRWVMSQVHWKYDGIEVQDYYNDVEKYSHSAVAAPGGFGYGDWLKRAYFETDYDSVYFPAGYGLISDREIRLVYSYSSDSAQNPAELYTYRFDEDGHLTEIISQHMDGMWAGYTTHYIVTDTPEDVIQDWVETKNIN